MGQHHRRWPKIKLAEAQRPMFAGFMFFCLYNFGNDNIVTAIIKLSPNISRAFICDVTDILASSTE